ncbi:MAG TPA: SH3-like domain-containing protein [Hyphomicrobiaceae bacterium]|nr:SH3-like domain-containing protein [Hyphomicrobiaceae bacterium]
MRAPRFRSLQSLALHPAAAIVVALLATPAAAQGMRTEVPYSVKGVAANDVLNIRDLPGGEQIIGRIPSDGRGIIALGPRVKTSGGTWAQIRYGTITGWVNVRFLAPGSLAASSVGAAALTARAPARAERFNGAWRHPRWNVTIDGDEIALAAVPAGDRPSRVLAAGSRDCGDVYERDLASLAVEEIPATFTDPRFYSWARSSTRDQSVALLVVTCGSPSHRYFFFLTEQQKMLVAEWDEHGWLMYEEFEHGLRHVGR